MKFTIIRTNKQNKLLVSTKTEKQFLQRIAKDNSKRSVANFRMSAPLMEGDYQFYKGMKEWQMVYPAAEFGKDESDNLVFKKSNGLVMLHFTHLQTSQEIEAAKKATQILPMTLAAITGADGRSLIVLVRIYDEDGNTPAKEADAEILYKAGYEQAKKLYLTLVNAEIKAEKVSLQANFMLTLDPEPYYNPFAIITLIYSVLLIDTLKALQRRFL